MNNPNLKQDQISKHTALATIAGLSLLYIGFMASFAALFSQVF